MGSLLEVNAIVESKREKVQSLPPIVNLAALFVSQYVLDDFSHLIDTHTLELNIQDRAKVNAFFALFFFFLVSIINFGRYACLCSNFC